MPSRSSLLLALALAVWGCGLPTAASGPGGTFHADFTAASGVNGDVTTFDANQITGQIGSESKYHGTVCPKTGSCGSGYRKLEINIPEAPAAGKTYQLGLEQIGQPPPAATVIYSDAKTTPGIWAWEAASGTATVESVKGGDVTVTISDAAMQPHPLLGGGATGTFTLNGKAALTNLPSK